MLTFADLCSRHQCDKGRFSPGIGHGYDYGSILDHLRSKPIRLLEIGVGGGASIKVWLDYFTHPDARIIGVDNSNCHHEINPRHYLVKGDQSDSGFWTRFQCTFGYDFEIVVDDGSHMSDGIITSFECIWPYLHPGSLYIVEDLRCSYQQGYQVPGWPPAMRWVKSLMDDINAQTDYKPGPNEVYNYPQGTDGTRGIKRLTFMEELLVLEKK